MGFVKGIGDAGDGIGTISAGGASGLVGVGNALQSKGFLVGEHPAFGGVAPVHVEGSYHYRGRALDINWPGADEVSRLNALGVGLREQLGSRIAELFYPAYDPYGGHQGHLHLAMAKGGRINEEVFGIGLSGRSYSFGERGPETVLNDVQLKGMQGQSLKGLVIAGVLQTPFGPAELEGMVIDQIQEHDKYQAYRGRAY
jgi:hypothetical protein